MTRFNKENLTALQKLARLKLDEDEEKNLLESLQRVLDYVELLAEVPTDGVPCCNHVSQLQIQNVVREDEVGELLEREEFLKNAPDQIGGMIKVPPIMKN